jgi:hypothetical protein
LKYGDGKKSIEYHTQGLLLLTHVVCVLYRVLVFTETSYKRGEKAMPKEDSYTDLTRWGEAV